MKIQKIGIIGGTNGLGQSFAKFFMNKYAEAKTILVSGRSTQITNQQIIEECDLVIFAVPIQATEELIKNSRQFVKKTQIWLDFTSIKSQPMEAMRMATQDHPQLEYCGMHPLFGPLDDISGQIIIYCPGQISDNNLLIIKQLFEDFKLFELTAEKHDKVMGVVQCVSHFSDFVLGKTLQNLASELSVDELLKFSSPAYRVKIDLIGRMFAQNPALYSAISIQNKYGLKMQQAFIQAAQELEIILKQKDEQALETEFLNIGHYLGDKFCQTAWAKTQKFLEYEGKIRADQLSLSEKLKSREILDNKNTKYIGAIFGEENSHTDEASYLFKERSADTAVKYFKNIFEVFDAVEHKELEWGIVPFENSTKGSVFDTLDELFDRKNIVITAAKENEIIQNLIGLKSAKLSAIKTIISHPQALAQSQKFCRKNCPQAQVKNEYSTVIAANIVVQKQDATLAAIASKKTAQALGLTVLSSHIQEEENKTKFILIKHRDQINPKSYENLTITSFVFWFTADHAGNLANVLAFLADNKINLIKLDSRRASAKYGKYLFFLDAEISPDNFDKISKKLSNLVGGIKILGYF